MPSKSMPVSQAREIAQKLAREMDVELVDVELVKEPTGHFLRFYIEKPDGVALNDLEAFHRKIMPLVERVEYDYMEVSSPGADRPLKTERDFERAADMTVELKTYRPVNGGKRFTGRLVGLQGDCVVIEPEGGEALRFERKDVAIVRPLIEFDEEDLQDDSPAQ
ncbi:MAG: ribosome maturation factor RimP [Clostridia bacterium]|nr:ribosome maturation factor RimP [Clostridia bacterium]MBR6890607.1 ribosome maturation factor RimP [Clostridia bacterium]